MSLAFYEKAFANNYEELITYYPAFYQRVYEMQEILKAHGRLADGIENGIEQAYLNNFIDYADVDTIGKLEIFLKLDYNKAKTLEIRRGAIKAHFMGNGKLSAGIIANMIKAYVKAEVNIALKSRGNDPLLGEQSLCIQFKTDIENSIPIGDIVRTLKKQVPCHLKWVLIEILLIGLDLSGLEKILLRDMELHMHYPFFRNYGVDGSPRQRMNARNLYQGITLWNKEPIRLSNRTGILVNYQDMEKVKEQKFIQRTVFPFFQKNNADGLPVQEGRTKNIYHVCRIENEEELKAGLVKKKNLWRLDGSVPLNGSRKLNAKITEEGL